MINLDNIEAIKDIDKSNLFASILEIPNQIKQAWEEINAVDSPQECALATNVVIAGMGGSALGGRIVDSLLDERVRVPIETFTRQTLPNYVNEKSLVVISSYSGNTEETLAVYNQAVKRRAKIFVITTGGKLEKLAKKEGVQGYFIDPEANPSQQPRMGLGYSITATLALLAKCNFIHLTAEEMKTCISTVNQLLKDYLQEVPESKNLAKKIASVLKYKIPLLIASEHLIGITHAFKNMLNENSKTMSFLFDLPEANHHLMEGYRNPASNRNFLLTLFIQSDAYTDFIKKRYPLTQEVVEKNGIQTLVYKAISGTKLEQIFEILILGLCVSYYLAIIYGIDPTPITWVDYFKKELK